MLKFNILHIIGMEHYHYLNTSHVKVQLKIFFNCFFMLNYLNTSHVKVQLKNLCQEVYTLQNLNTSHVKVQLTPNSLSSLTSLI